MFISVDQILISGYCISRVWETDSGKCYKDNNLKKKKKFRCLPISAFIPILATMELTDLDHCLGVDLLIDRWVWWLFRWQWWSCSGIFVGFWGEVHVMKKCFWSAGWLWLDCFDHWLWDLGLIVFNFVDLGWFVNWVYGFDLLRIRCWLC